MRYKIDGHGHLLPKAHEIPAFMKEEKVFWISEDGSQMRQKGWSRPIDDKSYFVEGKLEWMERHNIDHEVILNLSQLYCNGMKKKLARDVMKFQNDFNAGIQSTFPKKFTCGFVIQPAYVKTALREIERCHKELGLDLMCLPTHFLHASGQWKSVGSSHMDPIFELANSYNLAVQIHPYDAPRIIGLQNKYWRFHLVWMCALSADTYHMMCANDIPSRFSQLRFCFSHGNQMAQVNLGRRIQGFKGRPDLFIGTPTPEKHLLSRNIYVDSIVHDILSFKLLVSRMTSGQIIAGIDDPYPLGEMDNVEGSYPGKVINDAVLMGVISRRERSEIWYDNVLNWLYGADQSQFIDRTGLN